jgi:glycosyltransferase involved in cell wall biosynthesis
MEFIENCFRSLLLTTYPNFEILFVNSGSIDENCKWLKHKIEQRKIYRVIKLLFCKKESIWEGISNGKNT